MAAGDISSGLSEIGGAISDLFGSQGASQAASSYQEASAIAGQNVQLAEQATNIQETQAQRQIYKTISGQQADVAASGFAESGSAIDLLRESQSQGALTKAMIAEQGAITENAYSEQAGLYAGLSGSAQASASGQQAGGLLQGAGGLINLASSAFGGGSSGGGGGSTLDTIISVGSTIASVVGWVVCTELHRQGRLPTRWYVPGARRFATYGDQELRGYYAWAIPATRHLRAKPQSMFSRFLEWMFNHRAEYIAAQAGVRGARKTACGWLTLAGAYGVSWLIGAFVGERDWTVLYREKA